VPDGLEAGSSQERTMTGFAFFSVGAMKSHFVNEHWLRSGLETLAMGGGAALLAFATGVLLKGLS